MKWSDVDWSGKTVMIPVTKNGSEHVIPLSLQALTLLRNRWSDGCSEAVFPSENGTKHWDRIRKRYWEM